MWGIGGLSECGSHINTAFMGTFDVLGRDEYCGLFGGGNYYSHGTRDIRYPIGFDGWMEGYV